MFSRQISSATIFTAALLLLNLNPISVAAESADGPAISNQRYKIAVCDWMILKRQKLGAFQLTKDIGADGVEVDMGSLGQRETFENHLADPEVRRQFQIGRAHV